MNMRASRARERPERDAQSEPLLLGVPRADSIVAGSTSYASDQITSLGDPRLGFARLSRPHRRRARTTATAPIASPATSTAAAAILQCGAIPTTRVAAAGVSTTAAGSELATTAWAEPCASPPLSSGAGDGANAAAGAGSGTAITVSGDAAVVGEAAGLLSTLTGYASLPRQASFDLCCLRCLRSYDFFRASWMGLLTGVVLSPGDVTSANPEEAVFSRALSAALFWGMAPRPFLRALMTRRHLGARERVE